MKEGDFVDKFYTCKEVAERYKVEVITVQEWIRQKKLSAIRIGNRYRIKESDLLEFEKARVTTNTDEKE